jgi:hypothetical protein
VHIRGLARTWLGREIANALTDCNVDKFCLIRYDGNKVSGHNCEFVAVESNMRPVVDADVGQAEQVRLSRCQGSLGVLASRR